MKEHSINTLNNFIAGYYINTHICDALIHYFNINATKFKGSVGDSRTGNEITNSEIKKSTECYVDNEELLKSYIKITKPALDLYKQKYIFCDEYAPWGLIEMTKIQHYLPGEGYYDWHTERCTASYPTVARHMVFMTYLNDVSDGGETEFYYQNLKIKPEKGLTLFWPADWTFTHRGITSTTEEKYIITGWYNFMNKENLLHAKQ